MLLRRGASLRPVSRVDSADGESGEELARRLSSPIYPGGGVYPRATKRSLEGRSDLVLATLGDGSYHHVSELMKKLGGAAECVTALGETVDRGYSVQRSGSSFRLRRREPLEKRQSLLGLFDGVDFLEESPGRMVADDLGQDDGDDGFNPEGDPVVELAGGLVLSDPPSSLTLPAAGSASMTTAILARKGSGKSYLGMVFVEELLETLGGVSVVVFDPTGVWWGLLATDDGDPSSYGVLLLGGPRGHEKIRSTDGAKVADVVFALKPRPVVVDLSEMSPAEQHELVSGFCERIIGLPHFPMHVVFDEADEFAPQKLGAISTHQKRSLGYVERMVMRGRSRGIGVTLITLRPAVIAKNVLSQVDVLWLLQMVAPADLRAVEDWLEGFDRKVTERQRFECLSQLPMLPVGTAYFLRGGESAMFRRFKVRRKRTYDSSKTLVVGANDNPRLSEPPKDVLEKVRSVLSRVDERAESEDMS